MTATRLALLTPAVAEIVRLADNTSKTEHIIIAKFNLNQTQFVWSTWLFIYIWHAVICTWTAMGTRTLLTQPAQVYFCRLGWVNQDGKFTTNSKCHPRPETRNKTTSFVRIMYIVCIIRSLGRRFDWQHSSRRGNRIAHRYQRNNNNNNNNNIVPRQKIIFTCIIVRFFYIFVRRSVDHSVCYLYHKQNRTQSHSPDVTPFPLLF